LNASGPSRQGGSGRGKQRRLEILLLLGAGCLVTLCILGVLVLRPELYEHVEHKTYDVLLAETRKRPPGPVPALIAIDDRSLAKLGQWPWPRHILARLVERLHAAGARIVALDLILSTRDQTSPQAVLEDLGPKASRALGTLPESTRDHDLVLAQTLTSLPTILGYKLLFTSLPESSTQCRVHPAIPPQPVPPAFDLHTARDAICFLPLLGQAAAGSGFINALPDSDGVLRRVPLVVRYGDEILPSLTLTMAWFDGQEALGLGQDLDGGFVQLGPRRMHADAQGNMLLRYRGPRGTFPTYSVADILDRPLPDLTGRVAIVGPTAAGLGDNQITPMDRVFPGIEVHATALDNMLQKDSLIRPAWAPGAEACTVLLMGLLSSLLLMVAGPTICILGLVGGTVALWSGSLWLLDNPGYWISPLSPALLLVANTITLSLIKYALEERKVRIRNQQLLQAQDATILSLTALAETRDPETGGHIKRTREYVLVLATCLATKPKFRHVLDPETIDLLHKSAPLHDIGKVGIADSILLKPGRLTEQECLDMQRHTTLGADTLAEAERLAFDASKRSYLSLAREIAQSHHEKWDGSGYPQGLKGEDIPLGGRLMALADVYDALISKRVYKDAMPHEEAVEIIRAGRGTHFDPDVVDAFLESREHFKIIASKYA
jgi:adenylate cyclase